MPIVTLIAGLVLLGFSGDALVRGSIAAAQRMRIPPIIIGLTIVALGTSAPELIVSLAAVLQDSPGLAIGNVIGSNVSNTLLVLGVPAIISPLFLTSHGIRRASVFMIVISLGLALLIRDGTVSRVEGFGLIAMLVVYLAYSGFIAVKARARTEFDAPTTTDTLATEASASTFKIMVLLGLGMLGLALGGKLTTDGAIALAKMLHISDTAIGLTVVAIGTSLPELAASISAALRRQTGVIIGNVIGSNIFNILGIVGVTSMVVPLQISQTIINFDIWIMVLATTALVPIAFSTRRINRFEGTLMTLAYITYTIVVFRIQMAS